MTRRRRRQRAAFLATVVTFLAVWSACGSLRSSPDPTAAPEPTPTFQSGLPTLSLPTPAAPPTLPAVTLRRSTPRPADGAPTRVPAPSATRPPPSPVALQLPDIGGVVERVRPAVVSVVSEVLTRDLFGRLFSDTQSGSGVIFDSRGFLLTNNHVVAGSSRVTVTLDDGAQFEAEVTGTDSLTDLAVLKIEGREFPWVPLADPATIRVGDWVIAIGNALALPGGPTVTVGVVSGLDRPFQISTNLQLYGLIQTDASINPGNSGGPLVTLQGEVAGINTVVARGDRAGREIEGIGFAVGMDTAVPVAVELMEKGRVQWAWMGVFLDDLDAEKAARVGVPLREGVLIPDLLRDGPAWEGGVRPGDVVVSMAGQKVSTVRDFIRLLRLDVHPGQDVEVVVFREKVELTFTVALGERPSQ